jgi:hypothetical protein
MILAKRQSYLGSSLIGRFLLPGLTGFQGGFGKNSEITKGLSILSLCQTDFLSVF